MNMAKSAKLKSTVERRGRPRKRAEQQRSVETRGAILDAAIAEFAERGFEGASIRAIADRLGLQHPLITYHFRSKDLLWRAAAEHAFAQIRAGWDTSAPENSDLPLAPLRSEAHPDECPWCLPRQGFPYFFYATRQHCERTAPGIGGCALNPRL